MIWEHGEEQVRKFLDDINSFHPSIIKFKMFRLLMRGGGVILLQIYM